MSSGLTGTSRLLRLIARRDRVRFPLWLVGLGGMIAVSALAVPPLYDTPQKVAAYAKTVGTSPVSHLMSGRQAGIDSIGGIVANEISQVAQLGVCLMVMFLVVRHTRAEEETGRAELLRSTVVGRHAAALSALVYGSCAAVLVGLVTTGAMLLAGLELTGSATYGVGLTLLGLCYVSVSMVAAEVATTARGALGIAGTAVAVGYLVRGVGAMRDSNLVWASPFGWAQRLDAFGEEQWWPAVPLVVLTGALLALVAWLTAHRDFGSGVLHQRPGHDRAARLLGSPFGLALRLQRGLLVGWAIGLSALGLLYGAVIPTVPDLVAANPDLGQVIGTSADAEQALIDAFLRYIDLFMAVVSTAFVVSSVLRLRSEEEAGRAEVVLATGVGRAAWMGAGLLVTGLGALLLSTLTGIGLAVGYALTAGTWEGFLGQVVAQLSYLPGVVLLGAAAVVVAGLWTRAWLAAWALVVFVFFQVMLSETLRLPDAIDGISPFWHLPGLPVADFTPWPGLVELGLAGALVAVGLGGYRRRDIGAT